MSSVHLTRRALLLAPLVVAVPLWAETPLVFHDGLVAYVPPGFEAEVDGATLRVVQSAAVRTPLSMTLRVARNFDLHRLWFPNRRGDIRYTTRNIGGAGSGGPVHELRAVREAVVPLALVARQQAERRPDFGIALDLLSSVHPLPG